MHSERTIALRKRPIPSDKLLPFPHAETIRELLHIHTDEDLLKNAGELAVLFGNGEFPDPGFVECLERKCGPRGDSLARQVLQPELPVFHLHRPAHVNLHSDKPFRFPARWIVVDNHAHQMSVQEMR